MSKVMSALDLDQRSILLVAMFPSLAIGLLNQFYLEPLYRYGITWFYLVDAIQWIVVPSLVWLFVLQPANIKTTDFGFRSPAIGVRTIESVCLFLFVALLLWIAYKPVHLIAYHFLWPYAGTFVYGTTIPKSFPWNTLVVIYFSVTAAFVEEVVFRGLPWAYFSIVVPAAHRKLLYVAITSILFAATHSEQGPHGMIATLSFGIASAMLYTKLQNLWPLVFGHFIGDVVSFWPK